MPLRTVYFLALIFAALALVPTAAHLFELINKMRLGPAEYRTVQQIYRGWSLFGFVIFGALASTFALTVMLRRYPVAFRPALVAFLCIVGTQVIFW